MQQNFKIAILLSIVIVLLFEDAQGKNLNNTDRSTIIPGVVVAKLRSNYHTIDIATATALSQHSILKMHRAFPQHDFSPALFRIVTMQFSPAIPPEEVASQLQQTGMFDYVEPKYLSYITATIPNDSLISQQFYLDQVKLFSAWDWEQGSRAIVIAIVDNGTDYRHPDLNDKLWTNLVEAGGVCGVDDDGNGFVDDVIGWDFGNDDNDPMYGTDEARVAAHGTHTAGIAGAMTNNITGIAGVGWNCRIMPIKVSADDDAMSIPFGYEGIVYAADQGAHIINNSWGRTGLYSQFEQDIIDYATSKGSIVIAAAGNTRKDEAFFPAAYVHVVAVAAVNETDVKASYSTTGKFVDLAAPGGDGTKGILSTFPVARGSYGEMNGTSFASPIVAGIMGLLINRFPHLDQTELIRQVVLTSDRIDHLNPNFIGLLGQGRANAFRALTMEPELLKDQPARVEFFKAAIYDSVWGNGNFLLERNEEIGVDAWYRNYAVSPNSNLTISLATDDPDITITRGQTTIPTIPPDAIFGIERQLSFKISPLANPHVAKLALTYAIDGQRGVDTLVTVIGKSSILLVDDDNGRRNLEEFYTSSLDRFGAPYLRWDHVQLGTPPAQALAQFPMVIWFCEWAFPSLSADDRLALQAYLKQGGNLFLSGQDIGWDLADPTGAPDSEYSESAANFYRDDLHSIYRSDISGSSMLIGIPGTIGQGLNFNIFQPQIAHHYQFPDWIEAAPEAQLIFKYDNEKGGGIAFSGNSSVINLGFGFEAMDSKFDESSLRFSKTRTEFMRRALDQLGPIRHQPISDSDKPIDSLAIQVGISPLINDLASLVLFWKTENMTEYSHEEMRRIEGTQFRNMIDLSSYLGQVQYYFKLATPFFEIVHPIASPAKPYSIHIGADRIPPQIFHIPLADIFIQNSARLVQAFVSDNVAVDYTSVWLHYVTAATKDSIQMTPAEKDWYQAFLPPIMKVGELVHYYFSASDQSPVANRTVSEIFSYQTGIEGFERGLDFWLVDSSSWQIDDADFYGGRYCLATFPGKSYPNNQNVSIRSRFGLRRRDLQKAMLQLWTKYEIEASKDYGFIEISADHGASWIRMGEPITGIKKNWLQLRYDLSGFYLDSSDTLLLRFRLQTDADQSQPLPGWFIDDISIQSTEIVAVPENSPGMDSRYPALAHVANFPNPFNSATRIHFEVNFAGEVDLEIINVLGQKIFVRSLGMLPPGRHAISWDGTNFEGRTCGSGIYFCRLRVTANPGKSLPQLEKIIKLIYLQ